MVVGIVQMRKGKPMAEYIVNEAAYPLATRQEIVGELIRCKDCKHNPKDEWFGCPMSHLNEKQRPETAWCWKGERRTDGCR